MKKPAAVALGNFDGIHIGHAALIREITEYKQTADREIKTCVWTFMEHSQNILNTGLVVQRITGTEEKIEILEKMGVDILVFQDFNIIKNLPPCEFVEKVLLKSLNAAYVVCGYNFRFGRGGTGGTELLNRKLAECQVGIKVIPPVTSGGEIASSSFIRSLISIGDMERAAELLGRPFAVKLPVIYGRQIGRKIGVPTINQIPPPGHVIPALGIYACTCTLNGKIYKAVTNIGTRPTVSGEFLNVETHIINFNGNLYGETVRVEFRKKIRDEIKFETLEELAAQIKRDIIFAGQLNFDSK